MCVFIIYLLGVLVALYILCCKYIEKCNMNRIDPITIFDKNVIFGILGYSLGSWVAVYLLFNEYE